MRLAAGLLVVSAVTGKRVHFRLKENETAEHFRVRNETVSHSGETDLAEHSREHDIAEHLHVQSKAVERILTGQAAEAAARTRTPPPQLGHLHRVRNATASSAQAALAQHGVGQQQQQRRSPEAAADAPTSTNESAESEPASKPHPVDEFDWKQADKPQVTKCFIILFVFGVMVSAAGIGGGGLFLSSLMVVGGLSARDAVPLSHTITMLGATGSLIINGRGWYAKGSADIDVDTVRMIIPASLLGSLFGFIMNAYVSSVTIMKLLVAILVVLIVLSGRIWHRQRQEEAGIVEETPTLTVEGLAKQTPIALPEVILAFMLLLVLSVCSVIRFHMAACRDSTENNFEEWWPVSCNHPVLRHFFGEQVYLWLLDPVRRDKFMLVMDSVPIFLCITFMVFYSMWMYCQKGWTASKVVSTQAVGWVTGVLCGLVGIGGGLIFSPFFLMSMDPIIAVGTSSTCLLWIATSATLQYAFTDRIIMSLALVYGTATFLAAITGTITIRMVRSRLPAGKSFITAVVVFVVVLTAAFAVVKLFKPSGTDNPLWVPPLR